MVKVEKKQKSFVQGERCSSCQGLFKESRTNKRARNTFGVEKSPAGHKGKSVVNQVNSRQSFEEGLSSPAFFPKFMCLPRTVLQAALQQGYLAVKNMTSVYKRIPCRSQYPISYKHNSYPECINGSLEEKDPSYQSSRVFLPFEKVTLFACFVR